jgi:Lsr2
MASIVSVVVSDDLDGSPNAETVAFGFDGVSYEIDLAEKNRARLARDFAPYVVAARRVRQRRPRTTNAGQPGSGTDRAAVRAWAKEQGLKISDRGRIGAQIIQRYEAAH